jgi:hypothetical protein
VSRDRIVGRPGITHERGFVSRPKDVTTPLRATLRPTMRRPETSVPGQTRPRRPPPWRAYARRVFPSKQTHMGRPDRGSPGSFASGRAAKAAADPHPTTAVHLQARSATADGAAPERLVGSGTPPIAGPSGACYGASARRIVTLRALDSCERVCRAVDSRRIARAQAYPWPPVRLICSISPWRRSLTS